MLEKSPTRGTPVSWREIQLPEVAGAHRGSARADTQVVLCRWLEHSRDSPRVPLGPTDDTEGAAGCGATSRRRLHVPASVGLCSRRRDPRRAQTATLLQGSSSLRLQSTRSDVNRKGFNALNGVHASIVRHDAVCLTVPMPSSQVAVAGIDALQPWNAHAHQYRGKSIGHRLRCTCRCVSVILDAAVAATDLLNVRVPQHLPYPICLSRITSSHVHAVTL